jgi:hypothetical protein
MKNEDRKKTFIKKVVNFIILFGILNIEIKEVSTCDDD